MTKQKLILLTLIGTFNNLYAGDDIFAPGLTEDEIVEFRKYLDVLIDPNPDDLFDPENQYVLDLERNTKILLEKAPYKSLTEEEMEVLDEYRYDSLTLDLKSELVRVKGNISELPEELRNKYKIFISAIEKQEKLGMTTDITDYSDYPYVFAAKFEKEPFVANVGESRGIDVGDYVTSIHLFLLQTLGEYTLDLA